MKFAERPTPFVAILIDLGGIEYVLTSADLASISAAIAAWVRGLVAQCTMVMTGSSADMLGRSWKSRSLTRLMSFGLSTQRNRDWTTFGQRSIESQKGARLTTVGTVPDQTTCRNEAMALTT